MLRDVARQKLERGLLARLAQVLQCLGAEKVLSASVDPFLLLRNEFGKAVGEGLCRVLQVVDDLVNKDAVICLVFLHVEYLGLGRANGSIRRARGESRIKLELALLRQRIDRVCRCN